MAEKHHLKFFSALNTNYNILQIQVLQSAGKLTFFHQVFVYQLQQLLLMIDNTSLCDYVGL